MMKKTMYLLFGAMLLVGSPLPAQTDQPGKTEKKTPAQVQKKAKPTWPLLSSAQKQLARRKVKQLGSKKPKKSAAAAADLKALGAGVTPFLVGRMSDLNPKLNPTLEEIALAVVRKENAPLITPLLSHHLKCIRLLAVRLLTRIRNKTAAPAIAAAFKHEKDVAIHEALGLCLCNLGDPRGLPLLYRITRQNFMPRRQEILRIGKQLQGTTANTWLTEKTRAKDSQEVLAALRLLAVTGNLTTVPHIRPLLHSQNHKLATETVNTLRAIIDGKPPFKHISVFDMIGLRKEWGRRTAGLKNKE